MPLHSSYPLDHPAEAFMYRRYCEDCDDVTPHQWVDQPVPIPQAHREETETCAKCGKVQYEGAYMPMRSDGTVEFTDD